MSFSSFGSTDLVDLSVQQRNLLLMKPLYLFEVNKRSYAAPDGTLLFDGLDTHYLALTALSHMMEGMAVATGYTWEEVVSHVAGVARAMVPALSPEHAGSVAERVLKALDNDSAAFEFEFFHAPTGRMRPYPFRLVEFEPDFEDIYRYKPTEAGYLVLMGMLDLEIEDHQMLIERMLKIMIERGRFQQALDLARRARVLSIEHRQKIQDYIRQAFRSPGTVSWIREMEPRLSQAMAHVRERQEEDRTMFDSVQEQLYTIADLEPREHLANIHKVLASAKEMRISLLDEVMRAGDDFLTAQQIAFRPRRSSGLPDLQYVLLPQLLQVEKRALIPFTEDLISGLLPPVFPKAIEFGTLVQVLMDLRTREDDDEEGPQDESITPFEDHPDPFPAEMVDEATDWLKRRLEGPQTRTIEDLLAQADEAGHSYTERLCMFYLLYRSFPETENLFPGVIVEKGDHIRNDIFRGDSLRFTRQRDPVS